MLDNSLISWKSKKQNTISLSLCEVAYKAINKAQSEIIWIHQLFKELNISIQLPTYLYCDNRFAIYLANNSVFHERIKHIEVTCHSIREMIDRGIIILKQVGTKFQITGIFIKALCEQQIIDASWNNKHLFQGLRE